MGDAHEKWNTETISDARLNENTHLTGTTAQRTASVAWPVKMIWWDETELRFYVNTGTEGSPVSTLLVPEETTLEKLVDFAAYRATVGASTQLKSTLDLTYTLTVSSTKPEVKHVDTALNVTTGIPIGDGTNTRVGGFSNETAGVRATLINFKTLAKTGSPTGDVFISIRDSSQGAKTSTLIGDAVDWVLNAEHEFYIDDTTMAINDRYGIEYNGGDGSNFISLDRVNSSIDVNTQSFIFTTTESTSSADMGQSEVTESFDRKQTFMATSGHWESNSEANPWIKWNFGVGNLKLLGGMYFMVDPANTATTCDIDWSDDDSAWVTHSTIDLSTLTDDVEAKKSIQLPVVGHRYWRLIADGTVILGLVKIIPLVTINASHLHKVPDLVAV